MGKGTQGINGGQGAVGADDRTDKGRGGKDILDEGRSQETGKDYPWEDRALKAAAQLMGEELLPLLGEIGRMKQIAPTEQVYLEVKDLLADFNYEMEDGSWRHLEFESDSITKKDLRRFRADEAVSSYQYEVDVITCVLCSSTVRDLMRELCQGESIYRVRLIRMKDKDADAVIHELERKQTAERGLERMELLELLLSPLMGGQMSQGERIKKGLGLLEKEREYLVEDELIRMQSVLYAFAMKFLKKEEIGEIRGVLKMTILGQMLMEDGRAEGREEGEGRVNQLNRKLIAEKRYNDLERATMDRAFQEELYERYGL